VTARTVSGMSRTYAVVRLLQHGPLEARRIVEIGGAGWTEREVSVALLRLRRSGRVAPPGRYGGKWTLRMGVGDALDGLHGGAPSGVSQGLPC
jgi:hypothetical protein